LATGIYLGTSSWTFDAWRGVFYPESLARSDYLSYYARQFPTVEVNTSFYALPEAATLVRWVESVPPGFTFALKFPRRISHEKRLAHSDAETMVLLDVLRALGPAAAPAFLQLPPDFSRQRFGKVLASYLDWLAPLASGLRIAVEVRAADLMTGAFGRFLAERGFAPVLVDRAAPSHRGREGTPDLYALWHTLWTDGKSGLNFAFVRWIGDDRNGPKGDRVISAPRDEALALWASRLAELHEAGCSVFGYMHNPYEGHSPASVRRLAAQLAALVDLPAWPPAGDSLLSAAQMRLL
jgi:uncharacterized protein YecE (DUF72 family)